jgi:hypothetical protein
MSYARKIKRFSCDGRQLEDNRWLVVEAFWWSGRRIVVKLGERSLSGPARRMMESIVIGGQMVWA